MNKNKIKKINNKEYIKKYILPYESDKIKLQYFKGLLEYDKEYIKEHKQFNTLYNEQ